jgi:hypothetical protein
MIGIKIAILTIPAFLAIPHWQSACHATAETIARSDRALVASVAVDGFCADPKGTARVWLDRARVAIRTNRSP